MNEYTNVVREFSQLRPAAQSQIVSAMDDDPEAAARALELSKATGVNPSIIAGDLETFERQHKTALASKIVSDNQRITDFINSNPLAAQLVHDDLGQLDTVSRTIDKLLPDAAGAKTSLRAFIEGFKHGWGEEGLMEWAYKPGKTETAEQILQDPGRRMLSTASAVLGLPVEVMFRAFGGAMHGAVKFTEAELVQIGMPEADARRVAREFGGYLELLTSGAHLPGSFQPKPANTPGLMARLDIARTQAFIRKVDPYVAVGEEPPVGVHPIVDEFKKRQLDTDIANLDEVLKETQASALRQRSPELYADFIRRHTSDAKIGIDAEAVRRLYGEKAPALDDNVLGWVPELQEKLKASEYGGDIEIPLADWLAKVDSNIAKELQSDIRLRRGGLTLNEAKELPKKEAPPIAGVDPVLDNIRTSSKLEPMLTPELKGRAPIEDIKLTKQDQKFTEEFLRRMREIGEEISPEDKHHLFAINDEAGRQVGDLHIRQAPDSKNLFVEWIGGTKDIATPTGGAANVYGPKLIKSLLRQLKEEFPDAEKLVGWRVSGAREKAGKLGAAEVKLSPERLEIDLKDLEKALAKDADRLAEILTGGKWVKYDQGVKALMKEERDFTAREAELVDKVNKIYGRILADETVYGFAHKIKVGGGGAEGVHWLRDHAKSTILLSLEAGDLPGVARHEALHALRRLNLFKDKEWESLVRAARDNNWLDKYQINERWGDKLAMEFKLEESIAEAYREWSKTGIKVKPEIETLFQRIKQFIEDFVEAVREVFGKELSFEEIFQRIEEGEVRRRQSDIAGVWESVRKAEPELPGITRLEDRDLFATAKTIGMTVDQYKRYLRKIEERNLEDVEWQQKRAEADAKRRLTKEWKENERAIREEVEVTLGERPDFTADTFFRTGVLYGEKLGRLPKLDRSLLTVEQRKAIPEEWVRDTGMHPDDVAGFFGYPSGAAMIDNVAQLVAARAQTGLQPKKFFDNFVDGEVERLMKERFGDLEQNILNEAKDHVISRTQLDIIHEEVLGLGTRAGLEMSITRDQMKAAVLDHFERMNIRLADRDKFLDRAAKAGREAEMALLKDNPGDAFKAKQKQFLALSLAHEAKALAKEQAQFGRLVRRFQEREVPRVEQEFNDFIQGLLLKADIPVKRSMDEIQRGRDRTGHPTFDNFVERVIDDGWEPTIADYIRQEAFRPLDDMSVGEFREFRDAIKSLAHIGRKVKQIELLGKEQDFTLFKAQVLDNITHLPIRSPDKRGKLPFRFDAEITRMEEIVKDLDLRKEMGPLFDALIRPMADAKHTEYNMLEQLNKRLVELRHGNKEWRKTLNDSIPQDFFIDPWDGTVFDLSREHMLGIMLNFGTRSNIDKFVRGWTKTNEQATIFETQLRNLFDRHATKQDWEFVQAVWDLFEGWKKQADEMYYKLSGVPPKWLPAEKMVTPHGEFAGGYYPVIFDRMRGNLDVIAEKQTTDAMFGPNYFRATTSSHYTKERTGFRAPVLFQRSIDEVGLRMQQLIHDIAYRPAVIEARKVIYDPTIRGAIRKHYGVEYEKQLDPWLKDIANHFNMDEQKVGFANAVMRRTRMNLVVHALGLNLKVILSPDVGKFNPVDALNVMRDMDANIKLAHEKSMEIPHTFRNIDRDFRESLERTIAQGGIKGIQADAARWAFLPLVKVSQGFRVITFVTEYKRRLAEGFPEGEAAALADSLVRERHGSGGLPDLPAMMRSNEGMKMMTMFYGYFNAMYNWQRQIPGQLRRQEWKEAMGTFYGTTLVGAAFGMLLFNQQKEGDSWGKVIAKALALQLGGTLPFLREATTYFAEGFKSSTPLATITQAIGSAYTDVRRKMEGKKVKKPIQHAANVIGLGFGLPLGQAGRTSQFLYDVKTREQRPRNFQEWVRGVIHGEARLKK